MARRKELEATGWKIGDASDFLGMDNQERQLLDIRDSLAAAIRRQRKAAAMSQKELGTRLKTSQSRIAKIERAASDVSLDQLVRALIAAGGHIEVKTVNSEARNGGPGYGETKGCCNSGSYLEIANLPLPESRRR